MCRFLFVIASLCAATIDVQPSAILAVHVGKAGGLTMRNLIKASHVESLVPFIHASSSLASCEHRYEHVIITVRDPVSRFVSAFNYRALLNPREETAFARAERQVFSSYRTANHLAEALGSDAAAQNAMGRVGHVDKTLSDYLGGLETLERWHARGTRFYLLHQSDDDAATLINELHVAVHAALLDAYGNATMAFRLTLPASKTTANKVSHYANVTEQKYLSESARHNLHAWYADDYAIIGWLEMRNAVAHHPRRFELGETRDDKRPLFPKEPKTIWWHKGDPPRPGGSLCRLPK